MGRPMPEMSMRDARELLGVTAAATPAEVRQAFRDAARRAHPDAGGDAGAFRQVVDAYQRLQDPERQSAPAPRARAPEPDLEITPKLALEGGDVDHAFPDGRRVRIELPAGLRSGDKVRVGDEDLCVYIRADEGVLVRGDDLWMTVKTTAATLRKGGRISVDTPLGRRSIWIDRKAAERGLVRVEGEGLPARGRRAQGHLFVRLTAAQGVADSAALALLRRFAAAWAA